MEKIIANDLKPFEPTILGISSEKKSIFGESMLKNSLKPSM